MLGSEVLLLACMVVPSAPAFTRHCNCTLRPSASLKFTIRAGCPALWTTSVHSVAPMVIAATVLGIGNTTPASVVRFTQLSQMFTSCARNTLMRVRRLSGNANAIPVFPVLLSTIAIVQVLIVYASKSSSWKSGQWKSNSPGAVSKSPASKSSQSISPPMSASSWMLRAFAT